MPGGKRAAQSSVGACKLLAVFALTQPMGVQGPQGLEIAVYGPLRLTPMLTCEGGQPCMCATTWALPSAVLGAVGPHGTHVPAAHAHVCWP